MSRGNRNEGSGGSRRDRGGRPSPHANAGGSAAGNGPALKVARGVLASGMGHRPVDVICAGMYRACSTWQYEVAAHLVERHRDGARSGYLTAAEYAESGRKAPAGWRVIKSHDAHPCFTRAIVEGRAVAIYAYRDVRDVAFSLMHKRRLTFDRLLQQGMIHQVLANDRYWTEQPNVLIQRYDEILADPVAAVRAIAQHLGIRPAAGEAERIASEYSLEANKARTEALRRQIEQSGVNLHDASSAQICDPGTLLHWNHVRNGRIGAWLDESTPRDRAILDRLCGRWLAAHGYPPSPREMWAASIGDRLRIERDLLRGWVSCQARTASERFPRLAAFARRMLGRTSPTAVGATAWGGSTGQDDERRPA